jgi:hypothetical protein
MNDAGQTADERRKRQEQERDQRRKNWEFGQSLRSETYAAMRAGRFDDAEAALNRLLDASGCARFDAVRGACLTTPPAMVARWIGDMIAVAARAPRDGPLTAIEIDFSNAGVSARDASRPANPDMEVSGYTDQFFAFSSASDAELVAACEGTATPWQGCFDWFPESSHYALEGLETINRELLRYKHAAERPEVIWIGDRIEAAPEAKAELAANLLLAAKFHRFMRDAIAQTVVPFPLVVIVDGNDEVHIRALHHRPPVGAPERARGPSLLGRPFVRRG